MKWIKVEDKLPPEDRIILLWVKNKENDDWSGERVGCFLRNKFYCNGGWDRTKEEITHWLKLPKHRPKY